MESYNSFIYLWVDNLKNRFYIGSHYGKIDDGYLFGGIDIKYEYKLRPNDFERMILSYHIVNNPSEIPRHPNRTFKEIWVSWEHFLGKEKMIKSITYEECKSFAIKNDINSQREWQQFSKLNKLPFNPQIKYKKEWISWYLFLDKNKENNYNGSN